MILKLELLMTMIRRGNTDNDDHDGGNDGVLEDI